jgi:hypothetical protein
MAAGLKFTPALTVKGEAPGLAKKGRVWFSTGMPALTRAQWREIFTEAGAHLYTEAGDIVHAGGGLVLIHTAQGGARRIQLRSGRAVERKFEPNSSVIFDAATGAEV